MEAISRAGGNLLEQVEMFDVYRGAQIGEEQKSVAFALRLRAEDRTLTDEEIARVMDKILRSCQKQFDAQIRS